MGHHDSDLSPLTPVRLRWRRQELLLTTGSYLVGRDATCHILLEESRVSRRHARITVDGTLVFVEDLGSMNGVLVNGVRVAQKRPVFDGDWITVGGEELEVSIGESGRFRARTETVDELSSVPPSSSHETDRRISEPPEDEETTQRSRALEILASIADRALETGRHKDAEDMLKTTLLDILQESSAGLPVDPDALEFCARYALRLAGAVGHPRWFDYTVDLMRAQKQPCSERIADAMHAALASIPHVDGSRLEGWKLALLASEAPPEHKRSARHIDDLLRSARAKGPR